MAEDRPQPGPDRPALAAALWVAVVVCALLPLMPALRSGQVPGAGPDVVSTLWGTWWFTQVGPVQAFGGWTDLVNHPAGAIGALLSPSTALTWALARPVLGDGGAMSLTVLVQVLGLAAGTAWLARRVGVSVQAAALAALVMVAARYLPYGAGEGSVVAITALPLPLGLGLLLAACRREHALLPAVGLALAMLWMAVENPYLAPVLPGCTALALLRPAGGWPARRRLVGALVLGLGGVLLVSMMFGRAAAPDYPVEVAGSTVRLAGLDLPLIDMPWARARAVDLVWPDAVEWTIDVASARNHPGGGRYLGLAAFFSAGLGLVLDRRRAWPWAALAGVGLLLGLGSMIGPVGGPFLYLNAVLDRVARPLTQPTRFLVIGLLGLALCAALAAEQLQRRLGSPALLGLAGLVLADGLLVGGPSLRLPSLVLPAFSCAEELPEGAVLTWPTDALGGWPAQAQLLQLAHEHPAAHRGIASWRLLQPRALDQLRALGWDRHTTTGIQAAALAAEGYRLVLVEAETPPDERAWLETSLGPPLTTCDGIVVHDLTRATRDRSPAPRAGGPASTSPALR